MKKNVAKTPPRLRFSPTAWAKLLYVRDAGDTEIGGFGLTRSDDLLFVEDLVLVSQAATWVRVEFDDSAVADYFDCMVDAGRRPEEFARIWIHTHPGSSAQPSATDESTFARVFGRADWAVMFILARGGQSFARLRYNTGPGAELPLAVDVDFARTFLGSDEAQWQAEYAACVRVPPEEPAPKIVADRGTRFTDLDDDIYDWWWQDPRDHPFDSEDGYGFICDYE